MSSDRTPEQIGDLPRIGRPANRALMGIGATTLDEVAELGRARLLALHGVGPKAIRILAEECERRGVTFAP